MVIFRKRHAFMTAKLSSFLYHLPRLITLAKFEKSELTPTCHHKPHKVLKFEEIDTNDLKWTNLGRKEIYHTNSEV